MNNPFSKYNSHFMRFGNKLVRISDSDPQSESDPNNLTYVTFSEDIFDNDVSNIKSIRFVSAKTIYPEITYVTFDPIAFFDDISNIQTISFTSNKENIAPEEIIREVQ